MIRRDLLKLGAGVLGAVIFAPFLGPRVGRAVATVADEAVKAAPSGPWRMIAWREQVFGDELGRRCESWVDRIGFCGIFQDQETLELRRNVVQFDHHPEVTGSRLESRAEARKLLGIWCDELNAHWPPDVWRRATQQYDVLDRRGKLVGWHYDARWPDASYGGYQALGVGCWSRTA